MKKPRTTITDIARELGISPSTVSRSLNNHPAISDKTRKEVVKLARKKNYQPNLLALHLLQKKANTIGVIVPEITSYFFSSIINGIRDYVNSLGVNMIIGQSNESYEEEKSIVQTFTSINVDGFLISPSSESKKNDHLEILVENNIPLVIFDRDCTGIEVDKVFVDEYNGAFQAVEDELVVEGKMEKYTSPTEVEEFVKQTTCDSLAIAVGTSHGAYKFSGGKGLQFDILSEIQNRLPGFPLVLHGGSAVNSEEIQRINAAGGQLGIDAKGLDSEELVKAMEYGVCKINIATDARLIWTRVHREFFKYTPAQFDPIVPGKSYMENFEEFILEKFDLLKSTGKAKQLKNIA